MSAPQDRWVLSKEAFEKFLAALDPDPDQAGRIYEQLRSKLLTFFRCNGCSEAEALTDETLDRAIRRLGEIEIVSLMPFVRGVARFVASEASKRGRKMASLEDLPAPVWDGQPPDHPPAVDPDSIRCLERCLRELAPDDENLIREYYQDEKRQKIDRKRRLAESLRISAGALRIKAFRLRRQLQKCVERCVQFPISGHL